MSVTFYILLAISILFLVVIAYLITPKTLLTGIHFIFGEFGSGKTFYAVRSLIRTRKNPKNIVIANQWTRANDIRFRTRTDLVNIWIDLYKFHYFVRQFRDAPPLWHASWILGTPLMQKEYQEYIMARDDFFTEYGYNIQDFDFNFAHMLFDEVAITFNNRNFSKNFTGEIEKIMPLLYQPRKIGIRLDCILQSPIDADTKFRRICNSWVKHYTFLGFLRIEKWYYIPDPDNFNLETAEQTARYWNWHFMHIRSAKRNGMDYYTREVIDPSLPDMYIPGDVFRFLVKNENRFLPSKKKTLIERFLHK